MNEEVLKPGVLKPVFLRDMIRIADVEFIVTTTPTSEEVVELIDIMETVPPKRKRGRPPKKKPVAFDFGKFVKAGTEVEVRMDEAGYDGAWFPGTALESVNKMVSNFL